MGDGCGVAVEVGGSSGVPMGWVVAGSEVGVVVASGVGVAMGESDVGPGVAVGVGRNSTDVGVMVGWAVGVIGAVGVIVAVAVIGAVVAGVSSWINPGCGVTGMSVAVSRTVAVKTPGVPSKGSVLAWAVDGAATVAVATPAASVVVVMTMTGRVAVDTSRGATALGSGASVVVAGNGVKNRGGCVTTRGPVSTGVAGPAFGPSPIAMNSPPSSLVNQSLSASSVGSR